MKFFSVCLSRAESDQTVDRIEKNFRARIRSVRRGARRDGNFVGFIGLNVPRFVVYFTPCVEIGWRLAAEYWGARMTSIIRV